MCSAGLPAAGHASQQSLLGTSPEPGLEASSGAVGDGQQAVEVPEEAVAVSSSRVHGPHLR